MMDEIARLPIIPPTDIFDLKASPFQGGFGFLDLDLEASMGQGKRPRVIEENLHGR